MKLIALCLGLLVSKSAAITKEEVLAMEKPTYAKEGRYDSSLLPVLPDNDANIEGGTNVTEPYPFFANYIVCGGTLIHDDIILTAAHCVEEGGQISASTLPTIPVFLNGLFLYQGNMRQIQEIVVHPDYNGDTFENDYAILKLSTSALVNGFGGPSDMETIEINRDPFNPKIFENVVAIGQGRTSINGPRPPILQETTLRFVNDVECDRFW